MLSLRLPLDATEQWLEDTGQEVNTGKSLVFTTKHGEATVVTIARAPIPLTEEFRCLGVGLRVAGVAGTGPLLQQRLERAEELLSRVHGVQGGRACTAEAIATLVLAVGLFGAEVADITKTDLRKLETGVRRAAWGPCRGGRAKEVVFAVLMKGHKLSPLMKVSYMQVGWLIRADCKPGRRLYRPCGRPRAADRDQQDRWAGCSTQCGT